MIASYMIGLAIADLVTRFHKLMRHRRRVHWDWLIFAASLLVDAATGRSSSASAERLDQP